MMSRTKPQGEEPEYRSDNGQQKENQRIKRGTRLVK